MDKGWIALHRKLLDWEWWDDHNTTRIFIYLLLKANHKDKKWKGIPVKRGQLITGLSTLHKVTGISVQSIRTSLKRLKSTGEITDKSTNQYRLITICRYDDYQNIGNQVTSQVTGKPTINQQSTNNQLTTNNNVNNVNNVNNKYRGKKKDKKFKKPTVEEVKKYCEERGNTINAENFVDFYESKGWKVGKNSMKDWKAAVRTWERRGESTKKKKFNSENLDQYQNLF